MNFPSTTNGNWEWRVAPRQLTASHAGTLREFTCTYGRASSFLLDQQASGKEGVEPFHEDFWGGRDASSTKGAWPRHPVIQEFNTWVWLRELSQRYGRPVALGSVPAEEWDAIAGWGADAVWLMGVWERSPVATRMAREHAGLREDCRRALSYFSHEDVVGSPYSVHRYVVDEHLGGPEGLAAAREMLAERGLRLILDFVPNHVAPDHPWVTEHPDYFIQGDRKDIDRAPAEFFEAGGRVIACGRDPFFPPWTDTAQVNAFNPGLRRAAIQTLRSISSQCDGLRCDMAMLLLNRIFEMTWGRRPGNSPPTDYWSEVIGALRQTHPDVLLMAEVYWGLEKDLRQLGFDLCYDKVLYDRLVHDSAETIRHHVLSDRADQERLVRFLENHDEPRAAATLSPQKHRAAAVILATLPGAKLFHDGQFEGRRVKLPIQLARRPDEAADEEMQAFYRRMLNLIRDDAFREGIWQLCERSGWPDNSSYVNLLAWSWRKEDRRYLVVVNYSEHRSQGRVRVPWEDLAGRSWRLFDSMTEERFERNGDEMRDPGLFVDLEGWGFHFLKLCA